jgi:phospholipid-binding lipoprotein MlaA
MPAVAQSPDPWIDNNRRIYALNDFFDRLIIRPVATTYRSLLPRFARQGVGNFFSNVDEINVFVNDLLQLKLGHAVSDTGRFVLNSTVGLGGLLDIASSVGLDKNEEDFGQTLAFWGVGAGPYLVLPVFGASNVRDTFGLVLDTVFNPIQYYRESALRYPLLLLEELDTRAAYLALDDLVVGDRYLFIREAYVQRRNFLVKDGVVEDEFGAF